MTVKVETFGTSNLEWLGSTHGLRNARTVTIDTAKFAGKAKKGVIPAGTPVTVTKGVATPYEDSKDLNGFLLTDVSATAGKTGAAVIDHGRINTDKLPEAFTAPAADKDKGQFVYITKGA